MDASTAVPKGESGVTLIELMIAIVVLAILATMAVPAFDDFRQRSIARGAAEQIASFWADARMEAVKRSQVVGVRFQERSGAVCLGAFAPPQVTCDCFTAGSCNIGRFPAAQSDWRGAALVDGISLGDHNGILRLDPRLGVLTDAADAGGITMRSPSDASEYHLRFAVNALGRAALCQPASSPKPLPDYLNRPC